MVADRREDISGAGEVIKNPKKTAHSTYERAV
jgi:hypothetical protein